MNMATGRSPPKQTVETTACFFYFIKNTIFACLFVIYILSHKKVSLSTIRFLTSP
jgi:hypothetical protein